ncbi:MAG: type IV toxin-antitoxin system AbiEi family antitoxin [Acidimicrobiia bacterium]
MTPRQIKNRIETGQWLGLHDFVYRVAGAPLTWKGALLAACWAGGFRAVASHRSAAALHGLAGGRLDIAEITCPRWRRARHDGLVVHETKALEACDIRLVDGIPVTSPERTLFDLGAVCGPVTVKMAFDKARRLGLVSCRSTERALFRLARPGRPGSRKLRAVLDERNPALPSPESEMETLMLEVIRRHGLPAPIPQYEIRVNGRFVARVDAAYPDHKIAIEYQSIQYHADHDPLIDDSRRRNRIQSLNWLVVDATHPELKSGGHLFCDALLGQLRTRGFGVAEGPIRARGDAKREVA